MSFNHSTAYDSQFRNTQVEMESAVQVGTTLASESLPSAKLPSGTFFRSHENHQMPSKGFWLSVWVGGNQIHSVEVGE